MWYCIVHIITRHFTLLTVQKYILYVLYNIKTNTRVHSTGKTLLLLNYRDIIGIYVFNIRPSGMIKFKSLPFVLSILEISIKIYEISKRIKAKKPRPESWQCNLHPIVMQFGLGFTFPTVCDRLHEYKLCCTDKIIRKTSLCGFHFADFWIMQTIEGRPKIEWCNLSRLCIMLLSQQHDYICSYTQLSS